MDIESIVERLRVVEEELRDLTYDAVQRAIAGDETAKGDERQLAKARRAVEKAIRDLTGLDAGDDDY
jgi:hypothetical protein